MTIKWIDGFDHYTAPDQIFDVSGNIVMNATTGRWGGGSIYDSNHDHCALKKFDKMDVCYIGFAFMYSSGSGFLRSNGFSILKLMSQGYTPFVHIYINNSQYPEVRNNADTLLGTGPNVVNVNMWYYFEVRVVPHASAGEVMLRINEQPVVNLTGVNTNSSGAETKVGAYGLRPVRYLCTTRFDDLWVDDAQFHGNCKINTYMPNSDGLYSDWARSGGSNDYEMIDEKPADGDTTYISSTAKGDKSSFGITTGALNTVKAMHMHTRAKASNTLTRRIRMFIRSGGTDYDQPPTGALLSSYKTYNRLALTDPQDGQPWNQTKLEAAEFGIKTVRMSTTTSTTSTTTAA